MLMRIQIWIKGVTKSAPKIYRELKSELILYRKEYIPLSLSKVKKLI